ncbi:MAG: hypothetical protein WAL94_02155 [Bacteroidales bacterium]|jgi:hypothetical protein
MAVDFLCKACRGILNVKTSIIISATKINSTKRGLVYLNPELGNYTNTTHPSFGMEDGAEYIYNCPICHSQLNSAKYPHLVRIILRDENGKESDIYFSNIAGEKCTYKLSETGVEKQGPDASKYDKYFDIPDEDRKYL